MRVVPLASTMAWASLFVLGLSREVTIERCPGNLQRGANLTWGILPIGIERLSQSNFACIHDGRPSAMMATGSRGLESGLSSFSDQIPLEFR